MVHEYGGLHYNASIFIYIIGLPFIDTLRRIYWHIEDKAFKDDLVDGWEDEIDKFSEAYKALKNTKGKPISIPPNVSDKY